MSNDARKQYDDAVDLMRELHLRDDPSAEDRTLFQMVRSLDAMVTMLRARVDELEGRVEAGETAMRAVDLAAAGTTEDAAGFDDRIWSETDEARYQAERERKGPD